MACSTVSPRTDADARPREASHHDGGRCANWTVLLMLHMVRLAITGLTLLLAAGSSDTATGQSASSNEANQVVPGEFVIDPPTLENLGFEWFIEG